MSFLSIFTLCFICIFNTSTFATGGAKDMVKIRIGWQVPWAVQGQLVQILKHTDILKKNGIEAEFIGKTFGPQLNELALASEIDVVLTADQPALTLFSKDKGWKAISRLMYNRTSIYVPPKSDIQVISDLKGKTIGVPMGAAAERVTIDALKTNGLTPNTDVRLVNLDIKEQGPLVSKDKDAKKWDTMDALSGFDPIPAIFEARGLVRVLFVGKVVSLILMNESFLKATPKVGAKVVKSFLQAYDYYRANVEQADKWFMAEARLDGADTKACSIAASLEPNLTAKSKNDIKLSLNEDDFIIIQRATDFLEPKLGKKVDFKSYFDTSYANEVLH